MTKAMTREDYRMLFDHVIFGKYQVWERERRIYTARDNAYGSDYTHEWKMDDPKVEQVFTTALSVRNDWKTHIEGEFAKLKL
ncbi:MAG: hypothetical protein AAB454_00335 [Patescibacteria group bacterium]